VLEPYELMLAQETAAWEAVTALARDQRQAIVMREAQRVDALRGDLRDTLRLALLAHEQTLQARPAPPTGEFRGQEEATQRAQLSARDALRFNLELLREACSYLEMLRSATAPHETPVGYGPDRRPRVVAVATARKVA